MYFGPVLKIKFSRRQVPNGMDYRTPWASDGQPIEVVSAHWPKLDHSMPPTDQVLWTYTGKHLWPVVYGNRWINQCVLRAALLAELQGVLSRHDIHVLCALSWLNLQELPNLRELYTQRLLPSLSLHNAVQAGRGMLLFGGSPGKGAQQEETFARSGDTQSAPMEGRGHVFLINHVGRAVELFQNQPEANQPDSLSLDGLMHTLAHLPGRNLEDLMQRSREGELCELILQTFSQCQLKQESSKAAEAMRRHLRSSFADARFSRKFKGKWTSAEVRDCVWGLIANSWEAMSRPWDLLLEAAIDYLDPSSDAIKLMKLYWGPRPALAGLSPFLVWPLKNVVIPALMKMNVSPKPVDVDATLTAILTDYREVMEHIRENDRERKSPRRRRGEKSSSKKTKPPGSDGEPTDDDIPDDDSPLDSLLDGHDDDSDER